MQPLTVTHSSVFVQVVTSWTATLEAAEGVDALSPLAQPRELLALIDVCKNGNNACLQDLNETESIQQVLVLSQRRNTYLPILR